MKQNQKYKWLTLRRKHGVKKGERNRNDCIRRNLQGAPIDGEKHLRNDIPDSLRMYSRG